MGYDMTITTNNVYLQFQELKTKYFQTFSECKEAMNGREKEALDDEIASRKTELTEIRQKYSNLRFEIESQIYSLFGLQIDFYEYGGPTVEDIDKIVQKLSEVQHDNN